MAATRATKHVSDVTHTLSILIILYILSVIFITQNLEVYVCNKAYVHFVHFHFF